jgi:hypothetical protein
MKRCAQCFIATYCQKSCQTEHWNTSHKLSCKCLRLYTPMVDGIKTALNNLSLHLIDFVSTDDDEDDGDSKNENDDDDEVSTNDDLDYYYHYYDNCEDDDNKEKGILSNDNVDTND